MWRCPSSWQLRKKILAILTRGEEFEPTKKTSQTQYKEFKTKTGIKKYNNACYNAWNMKPGARAWEQLQPQRKLA